MDAALLASVAFTSAVVGGFVGAWICGRRVVGMVRTRRLAIVGPDGKTRGYWATDGGTVSLVLADENQTQRVGLMCGAKPDELACIAINDGAGCIRVCAMVDEFNRDVGLLAPDGEAEISLGQAAKENRKCH